MFSSCFSKWGVLSLFIFLSSTSAYAQHLGPPSIAEHAYGVNRRVETSSVLRGDTTGYGGISGDFTEPSMAPDSVFNPSDSAPQFYLGLGYDPDTIQVDAGLVYEARLGILMVVGPAKGKWQSFFEYKNGPAAPVNRNGKDPNDPRKDWSAERGSLGQCSVDVHVKGDGTVVLSVVTESVSDPKDIPVSAFSMTADTARYMYAKMVTAMTQRVDPAGYVLDDTWIKGSTFDIGTISRVNLVGGHFVLTPGIKNSWDATKSHGTGYTSRDKDATGTFIVDFPGAYKRNANGSDPILPADYYSKSETVDISLRKALGRVRGIRVRRGGHR